VIRAASGTVCLNPAPGSCGGPEGKGLPGGAAFPAPSEPPGALVVKTSAGAAWFSVNDRSGHTFQSHDGFFEFDVLIR
jgi:hypothetical protein